MDNLKEIKNIFDILFKSESIKPRNHTIIGKIDEENVVAYVAEDRNFGCISVGDMEITYSTYSPFFRYETSGNIKFLTIEEIIPILKKAIILLYKWETSNADKKTQ